MILLNPVITIDGDDVSKITKAIEWNETAEAKDSTMFGDGNTRNEGGLKGGTVRLSFKLEYGTGTINDYVGGMLGQHVTIRFAADSNDDGRRVDCLVTELPHGGAVGDFATMDVTWPMSGPVTAMGS